MVEYQCGGDVGTLRSGRGFTLGSDGLCTLGRYEGSLSIFRGRCGGGVGGFGQHIEGYMQPESRR